MWAQKHKNGFTIVELLIVIIVIGILSAVVVVAYTGITTQARTSASLSTVDQVRAKANLWNAAIGSYPDLAQLRTNTLAPTDIDTPGGASGPAEAKLPTPAMAIGATIDETRADQGKTVYYTPCWNGTTFSGATISYWDFVTSSAVDVDLGTCP